MSYKGIKIEWSSLFLSESAEVTADSLWPLKKRQMRFIIKEVERKGTRAILRNISALIDAEAEGAASYISEACSFL